MPTPVARRVVTKRMPLTGAKASAPLDLSRAGMPALDSILSASMLSVPGGKFRIIRTVEIDSYETSGPASRLARALRGKPPSPAAISKVLAKKPVGDNFGGTARKAAKLSISSAEVETFSDVRTLIESFVPDDARISQVPRITVAAGSRRVKSEERNVRVRAFLYAASRENDNDFHLIIGRKPTRTPEMYMTAELSGLPPKTAEAFAPLKATRDAFKGFFKADIPGLTYDFYDPPIPVIVEGSLFFDMSHATGQRPGPPSLKSRMPTIWEIHPISSIAFEP